MDVEYKEWIDLSNPEHQGLLVKAAIALANHGGGAIVLGFKSIEDGNLVLCDEEAPQDVRAAYAVQRIQQAISKFAEPPFEISCRYELRPNSQKVHPIIEVPSGLPDPIIVAKSSPGERPLIKGMFFMRRPGPESSQPKTWHDWRSLVDSFVQRTQSSVASGPYADVVPSASRSPRTVRDRMSDRVRPRRLLTPVDPNSVLDESERYVLTHPVSERRVNEFISKLKSILEDSCPSLALADAAGVQTLLNAYDSSLVFGFEMISYKGPFVDGSNWFEVRERSFAQNIDRYLLNQFAELLEERGLRDTGELQPTYQSLREYVEESKRELTLLGGTPNLVVLLQSANASRLDPFLIEDHRWWNEPRQIGDRNVAMVSQVTGSLASLPVLQFFNRRNLAQSLIAVVDLTDYELVLAPAENNSEDYVSFSVTAYTDRDAIEALTADPSLQQQLSYDDTGEIQPISFDEAVLKMQLMAKYVVRASGEFREKYTPLLRIARIANSEALTVDQGLQAPANTSTDPA